MGTVSPEQCSCRRLTPAGSIFETIMNGFTKIFFVAFVATAFAQKAQNSKALANQQREAKNLLGVFPFSNGDHHGHGLALPRRSQAAPRRSQNNFAARGQRQGGGEEVDLSLGSIAAAGERCIDKVVMIEETEYDDVITCKHSYSEKCHTTYTTDFEPQQ